MSKPNFAKASKEPTKPRRKNALAHGIYGQDILLPWESRKDFKKLLTDLRDEFHPEGRMENEIVFDLAHLRWQKIRVQQMFIAAAHSDPFVFDLIQSGETSWAGIHKYLKSIAGFSRMMSDAMSESFVEQAKEAASRVAAALTGVKIDNSEIKTAQGQAFVEVLKNFVTPLIEAHEAGPRAEDSLRRTYSPESFEPIIRLEAMIDARIDKALGRLVRLKEYKRVAATYSPPLITADEPSGLKGELVQLKRSTE
jgi:hypothetical protein